MKTGDIVVIGVLGFIGLRMLSAENGGKNPLDGLLSGGINMFGGSGAPSPGGSGAPATDPFSGLLDALKGLLGGAGTGGGTRYSGAGGGGQSGNIFTVFDTALKTFENTTKNAGDTIVSGEKALFEGLYKNWQGASGLVDSSSNFVKNVGNVAIETGIGVGAIGATYLAVKYGSQVAPAAGRLSGSILDRITGAIKKGGGGGELAIGPLGIVGSPLFPSGQNPDPLHIFGSLAPRPQTVVDSGAVRARDVAINQAVLSRMGYSAGAVQGAVAMYAPNYNAPVMTPYTGIGSRYAYPASGSPPAGFRPYTENGLTPAQQATYNAMMTGA